METSVIDPTAARSEPEATEPPWSRGSYRLETGRAGYTVFDAELVEAASEIRDHVKIDHETGAAANRLKFDQEGRALLERDAPPRLRG